MEPARKFKIIVNSKECGTCSGATPSAVAKKVVKKLCGTSSKTVRFSLKECKRGCERVCGPYQGRMEKLDKPYTRAGKKITHRVVCGKARKMRGGLGNNMTELSEIKDRDLTIEDFVINQSSSNNHFIIKYIGTIPYLFLYSNEIVSSRKGNIYFNQYLKYYKFSISINCKIFQYREGKITEYIIDDSNIQSLYEIGLFKLLLQGSSFNENGTCLAVGTPIEIIQKIYPEYREIIDCLKKLILMYKKYKRNVNYQSYKRNVNTEL